MKKVGIVINQKKQGAVELAAKIRAWLGKRDLAVVDSMAQPVEQFVEDADFLISLGGDGTILSIVGHLRNRSVPVLGVNLGSLGFLTEVKQSEVFEELTAYFQQPTIEDRLMLSCAAWSKTRQTERRFLALNDIVISREGLARILRLDVFVSGEKLTSFRGDGVIIATPTGSTAYSLSANGAVVHPKLDVIVITPICPHALSLRSIVIGADEKINVQVRTDDPAEKALLTADGQEKIEIDDSYTVEVGRSNTPFKLIKSTKRSYLETLRENFKLPDSEK
ncbi:MAG TPA: NAD(+)/NADH kinase [Candidatus Omnitrophota bacterium]|jgi:NAD+ kinase|nr:MAG: putative inorganic polyphosphate/ATP-NAD kinase [Candidatus Omnitrophica bacterium ADurb.Bin314]HOE68498.1 NAD(+)/NADH kinase [Candidatus Omnitrophota bacterium]HPW65379.1 NAD(+)/NADH kinase [Candidatus Omnitrophota bacterium]HQB94153.1 NAD(+)/NADH kinase [Candidatus Omnitrophota bacterium]